MTLERRVIRVDTWARSRVDWILFSPGDEVAGKRRVRYDLILSRIGSVALITIAPICLLRVATGTRFIPCLDLPLGK